MLISGILPRIDAENAFYNKASSTNRRLKRLCEEEDVAFANTWDHFYERPDLYRDDGLHLNDIGSARLGRLLNDAAMSY